MTESAPPEPEVVSFGRYRLLRHRREIWADGVPLKLGTKAFDVLVTLIDAGGATVSKDELMSKVWAGRIVEENSLEAQVAALRRALGPDRTLVRTIPGRGYLFAGGTGAPEHVTTGNAPSANIPNLESELIGRTPEVRAVGTLVMSHRMVTLTGSGGIGKTRLAIEVARSLRPRMAHGVRYAECAPISDPGLVATVVGTACGIQLAFPTPERVASALGTKHMLLVLDNCEHVLEEAARLAEALVRITPNARLLATSREPLGISGEHVFRVLPLTVPPLNARDPGEIRARGSVRLLLARVHAHGQAYEEKPELAAVEAAICRRLDGIPLAIELAAAQVANLGIHEVAARLGDRFDLLAGKRTALPRHRTLRATMDWSHELLSEDERTALRRLSVFAGRFTLACAGRVVESEDFSPDSIVSCISSLVAKSLVTAEFSSGRSDYRLLESTRVYAQEKLQAAGEADRFRDRHARYVADLFQRAYEEADRMPAGQWMETYASELDNLRGALAWSFAEGGDLALGVRLVAAAIPLWIQRSLFDECQTWIKLALDALAAQSDEEVRMRLLSALGTTLLSKNADGEEIDGAWSAVLDLAERNGNDEYRLRALHGLWLGRLYKGEVNDAMGLADRFVAIVARSADGIHHSLAHRVAGNTEFFRGNFVEARRRLDAMRTLPDPSDTAARTAHYLVNQRAIAATVRCQTLWIQGLQTEAASAVAELVDDVANAGHAFTQVNAVGLAACPIALVNGDLDALDRYLSLLDDVAPMIGGDLWGELRRSYRAVSSKGMKDPEAAAAQLGASLRRLADARLAFPYVVLLGEFVEMLARVRRGGEVVELIRAATDRCALQGRHWCMPELLRMAGIATSSGDDPDSWKAGETCIREGLALARRQGALSWELRCALSLARVLRERGRDEDVRGIVEAAIARFDPNENASEVAFARRFVRRPGIG